MRTRTQVSGSEMVGKPKLLLAVSVIFLVALSINLELHNSAPAKYIKGTFVLLCVCVGYCAFRTISESMFEHLYVQLTT